MNKKNSEGGLKTIISVLLFVLTFFIINDLFKNIGMAAITASSVTVFFKIRG
ncbi:MAG: hypothetical protein GX222_08590 [Ruminococcaceae bacterium]|nr:hypothetical protein [Oscillospiraceae bacterium]